MQHICGSSCCLAARVSEVRASKVVLVPEIRLGSLAISISRFLSVNVLTKVLHQRNLCFISD